MRKGTAILLGLIIIAGLVLTSERSLANGEASRIVVINEVAWGGTAASPEDEWIELYNTTDDAIDMSGWTLTAADGQQPGITIEDGKVIPAQGYFLLERTDEAVSDIEADQVYGDLQMDDSGETLELHNIDGELIDTANVNDNGGEWPAGTADPGYYSMERIDPPAADTDDNWASNDGVTRNGLDASGNPINATPKERNSTVEPSTAIKLISFTATPGRGTVTLAWETAIEIDTAGFNLYRATAEDGPYTRINDALVPAEGDAVSGASYSFVDQSGYGLFYYTLEDVDDYGVSTLHGPVEVMVLELFWRPVTPLPPQRVPIADKLIAGPDLSAEGRTLDKTLHKTLHDAAIEPVD